MELHLACVGNVLIVRRMSDSKIAANLPTRKRQREPDQDTKVRRVEHKGAEQEAEAKADATENLDGNIVHHISAERLHWVDGRQYEVWYSKFMQWGPRWKCADDVDAQCPNMVEAYVAEDIAIAVDLQAAEMAEMEETGQEETIAQKCARIDEILRGHSFD